MLLSTLAGEAPTDINPTKAGIKRPVLPLSKLPSNNSSLGISLVGVVPGDTDVDGVPNLVSPNPSLTSTRNDNYCVGPRVSSVGSKISEQNVSKDSNFKQLSCSDSLKLSCVKNIKPRKLMDCKLGCVLSCCRYCSYCSFTQASTKERNKSRSLSEQNKAWVVNMKKSELEPQQDFNFVGYRFILSTGRVLPTQDRWSALQEKLNSIKNKDTCTVRQFMSLIGLLTATEKQVLSGRLHMRPIQCHLKCHWHVPEILEKVIPVLKSLHPHLDWWLDGDNVLSRQPLHPL